jgi:hypothetical protein
MVPAGSAGAARSRSSRQVCSDSQEETKVFRRTESMTIWAVAPAITVDALLVDHVGNSASLARTRFASLPKLMDDPRHRRQRLREYARELSVGDHI